MLLFELLTGQHPTGLGAGSPIEFVKAITVGKTMRLSSAALSEDARLAAERAEQRATTPDRLRRVLRGDLETIVAKALKSDPAERYASVAEFAEDLRRVLEHQPITARPDTLRYRATKFVQRHWRPLAAGRGGAGACSSPSSSSTRSGCRPSAIARATKPTRRRGSARC